MSTVPITNTESFLTSIASEDTTVPVLNQRISCNQTVVTPGGQAIFNIPSSSGLVLNPRLRFTMRTTYPCVAPLPIVGGGGFWVSPFNTTAPIPKTANNAATGAQIPANQMLPSMYRPNFQGPAIVSGMSLWTNVEFMFGSATGNYWKARFDQPNNSFFNAAGAPQNNNPYFNNTAYPYDAFLRQNGATYPQVLRCQNFNASKMTTDNIYPPAVWSQNQGTAASVPMWAQMIFCNYTGSQPQYATDLGLGGYLNLFTQITLARSDGTKVSEWNNQHEAATVNLLRMIAMGPTEAKLYDKDMGCGVYHMADLIDANATIIPGTWATDKCTSYEMTHLDPIYGLPTSQSEIILTKEVTMPLALPLTNTWPIEQFCGQAKPGEAGASILLTLNMAPFNPYMFNDRPRYYNAIIDSLADAPTQKPVQALTNAPSPYNLKDDDALDVFYLDGPLIREIQWIPLYPSVYNAYVGQAAADVQLPAPVNYRSGGTGCILRVVCNKLRLTTNQLEDVLGSSTLTCAQGYATKSSANADLSYCPSYPMCPLYGGFSVFSELAYLDGPIGSTDHTNSFQHTPTPGVSDVLIGNSTYEALRGRRTLRHEQTAVWVDGNNIVSIELESKHTEKLKTFDEATMLNYEAKEPHTSNVVIKLARSVVLDIPIHDAYFGAFAGKESYNSGSPAVNPIPSFPNGIQAGLCVNQIPTQYFNTPLWCTRIAAGWNTTDLQTRPHFRIELTLATQSPCLPNMDLQGEMMAGLVNGHRAFTGYMTGPAENPGVQANLQKDPWALDTDDIDYNIGSTRPIPRVVYPTKIEYDSMYFTYQKGLISEDHQQLLSEDVKSERGLRVVVPYFTQINVPVFPSNMPPIMFIPTVEEIYGIRFGFRALNELEVFGLEAGIPVAAFSRLEMTRGSVKVLQKEPWELCSRIGTDYAVSQPSWSQLANINWSQNPFAPRKGAPTQYDLESLIRFVGCIYGASPLNALNNAKETNMALLMKTQALLDYYWCPTVGGPAYVAPGTTFSLKATAQRQYESSVVCPIFIYGGVVGNINLANGVNYQWLGAGVADQLNSGSNYVQFWDPRAQFGNPQALYNIYQYGVPSWDYSISAASLFNGRRFTTPNIDALVHAYNPANSNGNLYVPAGSNSQATALGSNFKLMDRLAVVGCQQLVSVGDCELYGTGDAGVQLNLQITIFHAFTTVIRETSVAQGVPITSVAFLS